MQKRTFIQTLGLFIAGKACISHSTAQAAEKPDEIKRHMRIVFVCFSKTGHTASVAEAVKAMTGCDTFQVKTVKP